MARTQGSRNQTYEARREALPAAVQARLGGAVAADYSERLKSFLLARGSHLTGLIKAQPRVPETLNVKSLEFGYACRLSTDR